MAVLSTPLMRSDIQHRNDAVIDPLTGMLNRKALDVRVHELAQAVGPRRATRSGLIVADLDHFKLVNDTHGHATSETSCSRDVAYVLRKHLRAFDLAYRLGGEEFVDPAPRLRPPADGRARRAAARGASARALLTGGVSVTVSIGVGASRAAKRFDYDGVFAEADEALYRAKRGGRNRVELAAGGPAAWTRSQRPEAASG